MEQQHTGMKEYFKWNKFKLQGVFASAKNIIQDEASNNLIISHMDRQYYFKEPLVNTETYSAAGYIESNEKCAYKFKLVSETNTILTLYDDRLEIAPCNGKMRCFASSGIVYGNRCFMVPGPAPFVVNGNGTTRFLTHAGKIKAFTENGGAIGTVSTGSEEFLSIESFFESDFCKNAKSKIYNQNTDAILKIGNIELYEGCTPIKDIIYLKLVDNSTLLVLTNDEMVVVYKNYIAKKAYDFSAVANSFDQIFFIDLIYALSMVSEIDMFRYGTDCHLEQFVSQLLLLGADPKILLSRMVKEGKYTKDLCRIFRRVDDKNKEIVSAYIDFEKLDVDEMFLVVIYKMELLDAFVEATVEKHKLFYLEELAAFYEKIGKKEIIDEMLIKHGIYLPFKDKKKDSQLNICIDVIIKLEDREIESQQNLEYKYN
ncbi:hypothetical protein ENBRE01_0531 [Enteropsectra breve]|nr:hypothetical protein ENBRE01_0531 [Enteropsectra breve]